MAGVLGTLSMGALALGSIAVGNLAWYEASHREIVKIGKKDIVTPSSKREVGYIFFETPFFGVNTTYFCDPQTWGNCLQTEDFIDEIYGEDVRDLERRIERGR